MRLQKLFAMGTTLLMQACSTTAGNSLNISDTMVSKIDRRVEKPKTDRCLNHRADAKLYKQCQAARIEATRFVQGLESNAEVCLENTFGEPITECYARGIVVDPGSRSLLIEVKEVDTARARNFRHVENVWFETEAAIDLYLAEHGY
jgi:hypothetical protein